MKSFKEVQKTRQNYHRNPARKAVHRSSLIVPELPAAKVSLSFLNHFLIKRRYEDVACKVTAIDDLGRLIDAITLPVTEPKVYSIVPSELFEEEAHSYIVEFFSSRNLFIPFPAVMINHVGADFVSVVHSYNRIFNDVFENDTVNSLQVPEASLDVEFSDDHEPFFVFSSGVLPVDDVITASLDGPAGILNARIPVKTGKLTHVVIGLNEIFGKTAGQNRVLKITQPPQFMFYGRLLAGTRLKSGGAFSANHTYYDSSDVSEYWPNAQPSFRTYPLIPGFGMAIRMYPIASPGCLTIRIEAGGGACGKTMVVHEQPLTSPGPECLDIDVTALLRARGVSATAVLVTAIPSEERSPTRVSHQLVYYSADVPSKLQASINVSLANDDAFLPAGKTSLSWGQVILGVDYRSGTGFAFNSSAGTESSVAVEFYCGAGKFLDTKFTLRPGDSKSFTGEELLASLIASGMPAAKMESVWFFARSQRPDLTGYSVHSHRLSGHTGGEHSF